MTGIFNTSYGGTELFVEYEYDAWGKVLSTTGSLATTIGVQNPYRYRGYRYDTELGMYYLNSGYYDPEKGRFLNADGLLDQRSVIGYNLFAYCQNNPINKVDSTGQMAATTTLLSTNFWNPVGWIAGAVLVVELIVLIVTACNIGNIEL